MTASPEIKNGLPVTERPDEFPEIPVEVENKSMPSTGVQPTPTQFKAQVSDDAGNPLIQTQQNKVITIQIPKPQQSLEVEAKGSVDESKTWWAAAFLRVIKKAIHFGWQVVVGGGTNGTT